MSYIVGVVRDDKIILIDKSAPLVDGKMHFHMLPIPTTGEQPIRIRTFAPGQIIRRTYGPDVYETTDHPEWVEKDGELFKMVVPVKKVAPKT